MRKVLGLQFTLFILIISIMNSCTKSSSLGSELLAGDQANIEFTDTLTLRMRSTIEDSIISHDPFRETPFSSFLVGDFNDPLFGNVKASIYSQLKANIPIIIDSADFQTATLDSIVLSLVYNTDGFYGVEDETFEISVFRMTEDMDPFQTYYSNQDFGFDPIAIATHTFTPNLDSIDLYVNDTTDITSSPQLRIPLSTELANEFLSQESPFTNITEHEDFVSFFKGLYIKANTETNSILNFNLASSGSSLSIYFTTDGTDAPVENRFTYAFASPPLPSGLPSMAKISRMQHTFSPEVNTAVADGFISGGQQLYLQALAGPNIELEIPYADKITSAIINKAELEFTINVQDTADFPNPEQIILATRDTDGKLVIIDDVDFAINKGNSSLFGGQVESSTSGESRLVYKMNIAAAFQDMADGVGTKTLFVRILPKQEQAARVILFGPEHSQYPAKLNLTYTRLSE